MAYGDGIGVHDLNMILSLTRTVLKNKDNPRFNEYVKIWLYEAVNLPTKYNHILSGLLIIINETGHDFKNQARLLSKCEKKLSSVPKDKANQLAEYYKSLLKTP